MTNRFGGWEVKKTESGKTHVVPLNDYKEHKPNDCWCHPVVEDEVTTHNSLDQREDYETGKKKPN